MLARLEALIEAATPLINSGKGAAASLRSDRKIAAEIATLYVYYTGHRVKGCSSSYLDATVALSAKLKYIKTMGESKFTLKAGALLKDVVAHRAKFMMVRGRETDELALYHLYTNPSCRVKFERVPDNLDELLEGFAARYQEANDAPSGTPGVSEDATAEAAKIVDEAHDEAAEIIAKAREAAKIENIIAEAEAKAAEVIAEAEAKAAEVIAEAEAKAAEVIAEAEAKAAESTEGHKAASGGKSKKSAPKADSAEPTLE